METINITNARKNFFQLVNEVNESYNPIQIVNNKGENAVLISENDWKDIEETLFLSSIPGYIESIMDIKENENWDEAEEYVRGEKW